MKYPKPTRIFVSVALLALLGACAQDSGSASSAAGALLDRSIGAAKVTSADYKLALVTSGDGPVTSVDSDGNIAPFGMASRAAVEVQPLQLAALAPVAAAASSTVYATQCVACHGANAQGVPGLGLDLTASELVANSSIAELIAFLKAGRGVDSPDSVTGIPMPAFSWMTDAQLTEVSEYLKSL